MPYVDAEERALQIQALMEKSEHDPRERARQRGRDLHKHLQLKGGDQQRALETLQLIHRIERSEVIGALREDLAQDHAAEVEGFLEGFPDPEPSVKDEDELLDRVADVAARRTRAGGPKPRL